MLIRFFNTSNESKLLILRLAVGAVVFAHGAQKLFGWWGGHGPAWYIEAFGQWFGFPAFLTVLVMLSDTIGSLLLAIGCATRFAAASISLVMIGAIYFVHGRWGFYMNWYVEERGEGFEFHLLILTMTIILTVWGAGRWSIDRWISSRLKNNHTT